MILQSFLYSRIASQLALSLSHSIPERFGYSVAEQIGRLIGSIHSLQHRVAVRANQWVISQKRMSGRELDRATDSVFRFTGYAIYDFYHNLMEPEVIQNKVEYSAKMEDYIQRCCEGKEGSLLVLPHVGNFDLAGRALALKGMEFQVLSYPQPPRGYQLQNEIRELPGVDITPMSISSMRAAADRLRNGGTVLTGLDRPLSDSNYRPRFFGYPASLPVAYIRLALKVGIPIIVTAVSRLPGGKYLIDASDPITMRSYPDLKTEVEANAESVLRCAERFILAAPQQWLMFYPVWPEVLPNVP